MPDESVVDHLAEYASNLSYADLDDNTVRIAKGRILDTIVCGIGGARSEDPALERLIEFSASQPAKRSGRILTTQKVAPLEYAAFANAGLVRYLDWNDSYLSWNDRYESPSAGHPSSNIGALLPVVQATGSDGRELLTATVLAYEIYCRLIDETALHVDGIDHVTIGQASCTLAIGRLLGLTETELAEAVNIALSSHIGLWQARAGELTEWKGLAFGNGARNAVVAVKLAKSGLSGPTHVVEGESGFSNLLTHPIDIEVGDLAGNGGDFLIADTSIKPYPVCGGIQDAMDAVFSLLAEQEFHWTEIVGIQMGVSKHTIDVCATGAKWKPQNRNTADHSLPWCVARALIDQEMGPQQFAEKNIDDERVHTLIDRIEVTEHRDPFVLRIETETDSFERKVREGPTNTFELRSDEMRTKLRIAAGNRLPTDRLDAVISWIDTLETKESIDDLFDLVEFS
ncbi:MmgE/PrpD family protein [Halobellus captivus]|uniref:MmgE/PrpD family protein n=1 Tax=Halobellus captivus TaxID=2592614 RepID=UPI0011A88919|nr:MmgE/PrpD family protein [Halobellus captivus]